MAKERIVSCGIISLLFALGGEGEGKEGAYETANETV